LESDLLPANLEDASSVEDTFSLDDTNSDRQSRVIGALSELSELNSSDNDNGEDWEMDVRELSLMVNFTLASTQLTTTSDNRGRRKKGENLWWPFRSKEVSMRFIFVIEDKLTSMYLLPKAHDWCTGDWIHTIDTAA
jgi:hypothetical protein